MATAKDMEQLEKKLEKLNAKLDAIAARRQKITAQMKENQRKVRNGGLVAFGICFERTFLKFPERRKQMLEDLERELDDLSKGRAEALMRIMEKRIASASTEKAAPAAPAASTSPLPPGVSLTEGVTVGADGLLEGSGKEWTQLPGLPADKKAEFLARGAKEAMSSGIVYIPGRVPLDEFKIRPEWLVAPK